LKLSKLAQARWIEDINDEEEEIEKALEDGPLALMNEIFPFDGRPKTIMSRKASMINGVGYIRSESTVEPRINQTAALSKGEYVRSTESNDNHVIQITPPEAIAIAEPAVDKAPFKNDQSSNYVLVEIPEEKDGDDIVQINPKLDAEIKPSIKSDIEVKVVLLGDIESDYTEDDSSSYQESSVSDSSTQPMTNSTWKPSVRAGLPSLRKNA
jgi:hypothetical protein